MPEAGLGLIQLMLQRALDTQSEHTRRLADLADQITLLTRNLLAVRQSAVLDAKVTALVNERVRLLGSRVDRIEKRLELSDA